MVAVEAEHPNFPVTVENGSVVVAAVIRRTPTPASDPTSIGYRITPGRTD